MILHWLYYHFGIDGSGPWYGFWSGFGSDLTEFAIIGSIVVAYRRHRCAACPRLALRGTHGEVEGTHYRTCHRHTNALDHAQLTERHARDFPEMHAHLGGARDPRAR